MALLHLLLEKLDDEMQALVDQALLSTDNDKPLIQKILFNQSVQRVKLLSEPAPPQTSIKEDEEWRVLSKEERKSQA